MKRTIFGPDHEAFRELVRAFVAKEAAVAFAEKRAPVWRGR